MIRLKVKKNNVAEKPFLKKGASIIGIIGISNELLEIHK